MFKYKSREILGFKFIDVAEFVMTEKPKKWSSFSVNENPQITGWPKIKWHHHDFSQADEGVYLFFVNDNKLPSYVGEFSYNIKDRMITYGVMDHHKVGFVAESLYNGDHVSMWLLHNPIININNHNFNISKTLESEILRKYSETALSWNRRGRLHVNKKWKERNCKTVLSIMENINV